MLLVRWEIRSTEGSVTIQSFAFVLFGALAKPVGSDFQAPSEACGQGLNRYTNRRCPCNDKPTQQAHHVEATSYQRQLNVMALHQR